MMCLRKKLRVAVICCALVIAHLLGIQPSHPFRVSTSQFGLSNGVAKAQSLADSIFYTVQPGDTLSAIALQFRTTIQQIAATNDIRNINTIRIGQTLIISSGVPSQRITGQNTPSPASSSPQAPVITQPVVQPAINPTSAPTPANMVGGASNMDSSASSSTVGTIEGPPSELPTNTLSTTKSVTTSIGISAETNASGTSYPDASNTRQESGCIASPGAGERVHKVRPGDTLYGIAGTNGVTITAVQQRNRLTSDRIRVGECLVVPSGYTATLAPDRRRDSERPQATDTPAASPTPISPQATPRARG
ncbi:MAG: LysM peptidoglycan-binding domain-containing protein [Chloroflexota bacterium]